MAFCEGLATWRNAFLLLLGFVIFACCFLLQYERDNDASLRFHSIESNVPEYTSKLMSRVVADRTREEKMSRIETDRKKEKKKSGRKPDTSTTDQPSTVVSIATQETTTSGDVQQETNTQTMFSTRNKNEWRGRGLEEEDDSDEEEEIRRLPKALLIGQKKCGTATVKSFLNLNPYFRSMVGERHFFDRNSSYAGGLDSYLGKMTKSKSYQITLEGSPRYFYTPWVPERVHAMNASIKLLVILCDPTRRLVSDFIALQIKGETLTRKLQDGRNPHILEQQTVDIVRKLGRYPSFEEAVFGTDGGINVNYSAVDNGIYVKHIHTWLRHFPLRQIHVIDAAKFKKRPWEEINKVADFIGVPATLTSDNFYYNEERGFYCKVKETKKGKKPKCMAKSKGREHPTIPEDQMEKIRQFYHPYNEKLYELLGTDLHWQ